MKKNSFVLIKVTNHDNSADFLEKLTISVENNAKKRAFDTKNKDNVLIHTTISLKNTNILSCSTRSLNYHLLGNVARDKFILGIFLCLCTYSLSEWISLLKSSSVRSDSSCTLHFGHTEGHFFLYYTRLVLFGFNHSKLTPRYIVSCHVYMNLDKADWIRLFIFTKNMQRENIFYTFHIYFNSHPRSLLLSTRTFQNFDNYGSPWPPLTKNLRTVNYCYCSGEL